MCHSVQHTCATRTRACLQTHLSSETSSCRPASECIAFTSTAIDRRNPKSRHALQHEWHVVWTHCGGPCAGAPMPLPPRVARCSPPLSCQHLRNSCRVGMWLPLTPPRWNAFSCAAVSCCMVVVSRLRPAASQHAWGLTVCNGFWRVKKASLGSPRHGNCSAQGHCT